MLPDADCRMCRVLDDEAEDAPKGKLAILDVMRKGHLESGRCTRTPDPEQPEPEQPVERPKLEPVVESDTMKRLRATMALRRLTNRHHH
jgi:hypothetical protein